MRRVDTVRKVFVLVVAKAPVPGRVKTRLCPPCTPEEAAALAEAALHDTFAAARRSGADEIVAALDGPPGPWLPAGVRVVPQVEGTFDRRLAAAWEATVGAGIQIGMDTPQVTGPLLDEVMASLDHPCTDAVLGDAADGGWWVIGLHRADRRVFEGVPMSRSDTGAHQRRRLAELGLRVADAPTLTDVDHFGDLEAVAAAAPDTYFSRAVAALTAGAR